MEGRRKEGREKREKGGGGGWEGRKEDEEKEEEEDQEEERSQERGERERDLGSSPGHTITAEHYVHLQSAVFFWY